MKNLISNPIKRGEFVTLFSGGGEIGSGTLLPNPIGPLLTITPPVGQRVRITNLSTPPPSNNWNLSVNIRFGDVEVLSLGAISGVVPNVIRSSIGNYQPYPESRPPHQNHKYITGKTDEPFHLEIAYLGTLNVTFYYGYEFGE